MALTTRGYPLSKGGGDLTPGTIAYYTVPLVLAPRSHRRNPPPPNPKQLSRPAWRVMKFKGEIQLRI